ncbi:ABC transporter substrate-binding protein [Pseudolabrys sp. FHR47]|uniref:ABC transporter substrate-binding protein n=1 Tax=Pseudolabrys sp. FHR47 TaxID=2562284 RepID=UPI001FED5150|nr:ABC transporter substrate-binding protein [Pseudolabrys sp. FHR47]
MTSAFRFLIGAALLAAAWLGTPAAPKAQESITLTDVAGRTVTVKRPVKHVILGEGRQLLALALLHPDPVSILAGWPADLQRQDKVTYDLYRQRFPGLDRVPIIGRGSADTFSIEQALAVQPDLAILSGGYGPSSHSPEILRRLEAAGIPVVFIDFVAKPLEHTLPSMELLGKVLGQEDRAAAFIDFYRSHMDRIARRLREADPPKPTVLMHAHAGLQDCCNSPGRATIGAFIDAAGGENIAVGVVKQLFGKLNLEYVIAKNPQVYVGTGGIHLQGTGGLVMGPGIPEEVSRKFLSEVVQRPGIAQLDAVKNGRVYGLWHLFSNIPINFLAVEALAKWFHPKLFADIDPDASLRELNEKFLPVPMHGTYWIGLK